MFFQNLTNGNATVGPHKVDIGLRNGSHSDLVIGSGEEGRKRADKYHSAVSSSAANCHSHLQQQSVNENTP